MRYVYLLDHHNHPTEVVREFCRLPKILQNYIDQVMLVNSGDSKSLRPELKGDLAKAKKFVQFCLDSYRAYYRIKSAESYARTQSQEG